MFLTKKSFEKKVKKLDHEYWNEGYSYRWDYMSYVIETLKKIGAKNICESGSFYIPLNSKSTLLENAKEELVNDRGEVHDLNDIPYPFEDDEFDCFVALQVWEHIENHPHAFEEACRISKNVILSIPYMWDWGDDMHKGIDDEKILSWVSGKKWDEEKIIHRRKILLWKNT